jgi:hypothetical protein
LYCPFVADQEVLQGDPYRWVVRVGNTVRRPVYPWSATVHELLRYLEAVGFSYSPRVLGIDVNGREVLSYIEGESGPAGWARVVDDSGLVVMARLLREYHQAVAGFRPAAVAGWAAHAGLADAGDVVCHGDFGPWNLVWQGIRPVGILDWDYAWPTRPIHDVAYALEYVAPFRDDRECMGALRYPAPPHRRQRIERFVEAYGLTSTDGLVDEVLYQQRIVLDRARRLAAEGHQPQGAWQQAGVFDLVEERIRWSREHRYLFE